MSAGAELPEGVPANAPGAAGRKRGGRPFPSAMYRAVATLVCVLSLGSPVLAGTLELDGALRQGGILRGKVDAGSRVALDGRPIKMSPDGQFVIGFARDAASKAKLEIKLPDGGRIKQELVLAPGNFLVQRIDGLPPQTVTPDPANLEKLLAEIEAVRQARRLQSKLGYAFGAFTWPVTGPISGQWGNQRILNGEPRSPHWGCDIAAAKGTPIAAPAGAIVRLAVTNYIITGGTVVLDHGYGLSTTYAHLDTIDVKLGQRVAQGDRIGTVGATGRVTGAHLHWGAEWNDVHVDPTTLVPPMPKPGQ